MFVRCGGIFFYVRRIFFRILRVIFRDVFFPFLECDFSRENFEIADV